MYVAKHDDLFVLCRMPDTGYLHHHQCDSFEPNRYLSGKSWYTNQAIIPSEDRFRVNYLDVSSKNQDFSTSRNNLHPHAVTTRGLLNLLIELAEFNYWSPKMEGKRNWGLVRYYLRQAATKIILAQRDALSALLYIPDQFNRDKADKNINECKEFFRNASNLPRYLVGELKTVEPNANRGYTVTIKNLHGVNFFLPDDGFEVFNKIARFVSNNSEISIRVLLMLAINKSTSGLLCINGLGLQMLNGDWIPVESTHDSNLVNHLISQNRRFNKPLRFDMSDSEMLHNALLLDCGAEVVTLDILGDISVTTNSSLIKKRMVDRQGNTPLTHWYWDISHSLTDTALPHKIEPKEGKSIHV